MKELKQIYTREEKEKLDNYLNKVGKGYVNYGLKYFCPTTMRSLIALYEKLQSKDVSVPVFIVAKHYGKKGLFTEQAYDEVADMLNVLNYNEEYEKKSYHFNLNEKLMKSENFSKGLVDFHNFEKHNYGTFIIEAEEYFLELDEERLSAILLFVIEHKNTVLYGNGDLIDKIFEKIDVPKFITLQVKYNPKNNVEEFMTYFSMISENKKYVFEPELIEKITHHVSEIGLLSRETIFELRQKLEKAWENDAIKIELNDDKKFMKASYFEDVSPAIEPERVKFLTNTFKEKAFKSNKQVKSLEESPSYNKLNELKGLDNLKEQVRNMFKFYEFNKKIGGKKPNLNMLFTGDSGTGKTTVANIMSGIFHDFGFTKVNKLVEVSGKDLIAGYVGQTAIKTKEVVDSAKGGILFIDEAYSLMYDSKFAPEAVSVLVSEMTKGETIFIFSGYEKEMNEFLEKNQGLKSKLPNKFYFENYSTDVLFEILVENMEEMNLSIDSEAKNCFKNAINKKRVFDGFGNIRFIENMIQKTLIRHSSLSLKTEDEMKITIESIPEKFRLLGGQKYSDGEDINLEELDGLKELSSLTGLEKVKEDVETLVSTLIFNQKLKSKGLNPMEFNLNSTLIGNPGTGKTTVARILTKVLFDLGYISENKLVEVSQKDLISSAIGDTAIKTGEVIKKSYGGVLFIDEAYSLMYDDKFAPEAIATLIKHMEDDKSRFVVFFAGYKDEMNQFLNLNPGLLSRIGNNLDFEDYKVEDLLTIMEDKLSEHELVMTDEASELVKENIIQDKSKKNFGNARYSINMVNEIFKSHAHLCVKNKIEEISIVEAEAIRNLK